MRRAAIGVGAGQQHEQVGAAGERGPRLHAVDAVAAVDRAGGRDDAGDVGAVVGLGDHDADHQLAGRDARQPPLLLLLGAAGDERAGEDLGPGDERAADAERAPRQLLGGDDHAEVVGLAAAGEPAVLLGHREPEAAELGEPGDDVFGDVGVGAVHVFGDGADLVLGEAAEGVGRELELVGQMARPGARSLEGGGDRLEELRASGGSPRTGTPVRASRGGRPIPSRDRAAWRRGPTARRR